MKIEVRHDASSICVMYQVNEALKAFGGYVGGYINFVEDHGGKIISIDQVQPHDIRKYTLQIVRDDSVGQKEKKVK